MTSQKPKLSLNDWVSLHSSLLEEERKEEVASAEVQVSGVSVKTLEARGIVLSHMVISERSTGLYGRPMFKIVLAKKNAVLPANNFSSGDIIAVCEEGPGQGKQLTTAVITNITQSSVRIVIDEDADELDAIADDAHLRIHKLANDVTYRRIKTGLNDLSKLVSSRASHLVEVLFCEAPPASRAPSLPPQLTESCGKLSLINRSLDSSQQEAVKFAIQRSDLAVIHGPPGTGKTTTLIEIIRQHVKLKSKILACAPSNLAVDNLVERLAGAGVRVVRVGHPARVTQLTQRFTLDARLHNSDESEILKDIHRDISDHLNQLKKAKDKGKRHSIRREIKTFRKELHEREMRLTKQVLMSCDVVLATLTSSSNDGPLRMMPPDHFDVIVIDECSQSIEAACYLALLRAPKLIIAGDHCQLPPTIMSTEAAAKGLDRSLMERIIDECSDEVVKMLTVQYRMNTDIMLWASEAMYRKELVAHSTVAKHLLSDLNDVEDNEDTENALVLIDTAGCDCWELETTEEQSKGNPQEAILVSCHVKALTSAGMRQQDIAVITPYNLQVELVRGLLRESHPGVEVRSVDGFQGREKEAVVMSLVRSNKQGIVGFLSENRRLNVAVTRARRHLAVVCDTETVGTDPFLEGFVDYISEHGVVKTAHEFQEELDTTHVETPECVVIAQRSTKDKSKKESRNKEHKKRNDKTVKKGDPKTDHRTKDIGPSKTKPPPPSEEENEKRRVEYEAVITNFLKSSSDIYEFPPDLNSFERRLIHDIAEKNGLLHESQGEGKQRHIVIRKKVVPPAETTQQSGNLNCDSRQSSLNADGVKPTVTHDVRTEENEREVDFAHSEDASDKSGDTHCKEEDLPCLDIDSSTEKCPYRKEFEDSSEKENSEKENEVIHKEECEKNGAKPKVKTIQTNDKIVRTRFIGGKYVEVAIPDGHETKDEVNSLTRSCISCGRRIPNDNYIVHSAQCERQVRAKKEGIKQKEIDKAAKKKSKKKSFKKGSNSENRNEEEDIDSLIAQFTKENNTCSYPQCKTPTTVIFQLCPFCRNTFCLAHHMAEVHGCGEQARQNARKMIIKEGVIYPGSGVPSSKSSEVKRKQVQRKLDKKLEDLSNQRKHKKADKDGKKN